MVITLFAIDIHIRISDCFIFFQTLFGHFGSTVCVIQGKSRKDLSSDSEEEKRRRRRDEKKKGKGGYKSRHRYDLDIDVHECKGVKRD